MSCRSQGTGPSLKERDPEERPDVAKKGKVSRARAFLGPGNQRARERVSQVKSQGASGAGTGLAQGDWSRSENGLFFFSHSLFYSSLSRLQKPSLGTVAHQVDSDGAGGCRPFGRFVSK